MDMDDNVIDTAKLAEEKGEAALTDSNTKKKAEREKVGYELENMSRVLPAQIKYISFSQEGRYQPVKKPTGGVILLHDTQSSEDKSLLELKAKKKTNNAAAAPVVGGSSQQGATPFTPARQTGDDALAALGFGAGAGVGAAAASGVLNAVDEDVEGGEEAELPDEFEVEDEDMADDDE